MMDGQWCDVVLEGGGVKGIGLVGALEELHRKGYRMRRAAGTSAGAIVGALVAAGMPIDKMLALMRELDYKQFRDEGFIDKLGLPGKTLSVWFEKGIYEGRFLRDWLTAELEKLGVKTFADLKITEPWAKVLPPEQRYKLVVIASDVSGGRLARLPWDYARYGLDPDTQLVADAVRASMSIPFFYEPVSLGKQTLVDGGMLSNFPISLFDRTPDWPTFGVKLAAKADANLVANPIHNTLDFAKSLLATMINAHDQMHIDDPATEARTIFVDTFKVKATDFDITPDTQAKLYQSGRSAAQEFLTGWDFTKWRQKYAK
ncbi:MAG TPA: patatin-like phospholipase family protein [Candidatus Saccharimonadales bacterium]|nr:patatin-like phospholipase family protein [Candidatus Saccharimonadales bacterium]